MIHSPWAQIAYLSTTFPLETGDLIATNTSAGSCCDWSRRRFSFSPERRAVRFARLVGIPGDIRGGSSRDELKAMGRGIARLEVPSADVLRRELGVVRGARIPLLVVAGGWSPSFDAVGARVAAVGGGGRHEIVTAPSHFPNLMSAFNPMLAAFMSAGEQARTPARSRPDHSVDDR